MNSIFSSIDLDQISFWIGFLTGIIFLWFFRRFLPIIRVFLTNLFNKAAILREGISTGTEIRFRNEILQYVQRKHLASEFCSLDEILVPPGVNFQPKPMDDKTLPRPLDSSEAVIPFIPDCPEIATAFFVPKRSLIEALSLGADIVILGEPGTGKTTTLCHLASQIARREEDLGDLKNCLPIFIDAKEILFLDDIHETVFDQVYSLVSKQASSITTTRLPLIIKNHLLNGTAVVLVDGIDELNLEEVSVVAQWINNIRINFPKTRFVTAASPHNHDSLLILQLHPVSISLWGRQEISIFIEKWQAVWEEIVNSQQTHPYSNTPTPILESYLRYSQYYYTPLEITLHFWSAFAGDALGNNPLEDIEAYLRRYEKEFPGGREYLHNLAKKTMLQGKSTFTKAELMEFPNFGNQNSAPIPQEKSSTPLSTTQSDVFKSFDPAFVNHLINHKLIVEIHSNQYAFNHQLFACYLATQDYWEPDEISTILGYLPWEGSRHSIQLITRNQDLSDLLLPISEEIDEPLGYLLVELCNWLRYASPKCRWVKQILRRSFTYLQTQEYQFGLQLRLVSKLSVAKECSTHILFRHLQTLNSPRSKVIGCLGAGLAGDSKSIPVLTELMRDPDIEVSISACVALAAIGEPGAMEAVASGLLLQDETLQICAAEMLATDPKLGYETLLEGSSYDNLLVRKAVAYGLRNIDQAWALDLLQKMQLEDPQWVVRDAAERALEGKLDSHPYTPVPFPDLVDTPWLIEFASSKDKGISKYQDAQEMLLQAVQHGTNQQKLHGLFRIPFWKDITDGVFITLFNAVYDEDSNIREAAYNSIWLILGRGIRIPSPKKYGF